MNTLPVRFRKEHPILASFVDRFLEERETHIVGIASQSHKPDLLVEMRGGLASLFDDQYNEGWGYGRNPVTGKIRLDGGFFYYDGAEIIGELEVFADQQLCQTFGLSFGDAWGTVRPTGGSDANRTLWDGVLMEGDPVVALDLAAGGHLTHWSDASETSKHQHCLRYHVNPRTGVMDYDEFESVIRQNKARLVVVDGTALVDAVNFRACREIVDRCSSRLGHRVLLIADIAHKAGLIAAQMGIFAGRDFQPQWWVDGFTFTFHKTMEGPDGGAIVWVNDALENDRGWEVKRKAGNRPMRWSERIQRCYFPGTHGKSPAHRTLLKAMCLERAQRLDFAARMNGILQRQRVFAEALLSGEIPLIGSEHPTSPGGNCHLVLVELDKLGLDGKTGVRLMRELGLIVNYNSLPGRDRQSPMNPPGLRIGTPAMADLTVENVKEIGEMIAWVLKHPEQANVHREVVREMAQEVWPYKPHDFIPDDDDSRCNSHGEGAGGSSGAAICQTTDEDGWEGT